MEVTRRKTRSQTQLETNGVVEAKNKKINVEDMPILKYFGKVTYHTTFVDCASACDGLLKFVETNEGILAMGFDMEWPFSFQTGPYKTALIQISPNLDECFLFHVSAMKNLPATMITLLAHPKVRLTGVCIKNDIRKLGRDFNINVDTMIENCIDCGVKANQILPVRQRWSMAKLVQHLLEMQISKDKKVRNSRWAVIPLSKEQQEYAATDAYASLKLYEVLSKMEMDLQNAENKEINLVA